MSSKVSEVPPNFLPQDPLRVVASFCDRRALNALNSTNSQIRRVINTKNPFQFNNEELEISFKNRSKYSIIRHSSFIAYENGAFKVKSLNVFQRFFRRWFKCYKSTHLQTLASASDLFASQSKEKLLFKSDRKSLIDLNIKLLGKRFVLSGELTGYTALVIHESLALNVDGHSLVGKVTTRCFGSELAVRFTLQDTKEYAEFHVASPRFVEITTKTSDGSFKKPMYLTGSMRVGIQNTYLMPNKKQTNKLCKAAYQIAQSIAKKANVNLVTPDLVLDPESFLYAPDLDLPLDPAPTILASLGFQRKTFRNQQYWGWNSENPSAHLPEVNVNLRCDV